MAYRRTDRVMRRLAARQDAILAAAQSLACEQGMDAVQIAPVAERAGIAAGTIYRYFASKTELVAALVSAVSERELAAMRQAADLAPGPLSALAAALATFAGRAGQNRQLTWALFAEPVDATLDRARRAYREAITVEVEARLRTAMADLQVPDSDPALLAPAIMGSLIGGLIDPLASRIEGDPAKLRGAVQMLTLFTLRGLGIVDARARGLVVQTTLPESGQDMA